MAKYVIHKKTFYYTDEAFFSGGKGSIVSIFDNIEAAKKEKSIEDINSIQGLEGMNILDFFFDVPDYNEIYQKVENYLKSEFNLAIENESYCEFPSDMTYKQAQMFLDIIHISFHDIVEYPDDEILNPEDFALDIEEDIEF